MRHAQAQPGGQSDHARLLTPHGAWQARRIGSFLRKNGHVPAEVHVSDAHRTQETLAWMEDSIGHRLNSQAHSWLYLPDHRRLLSAIHAGPDSNVMYLSHNPGVMQVASELADQRVPFPEATVAGFERANGRYALKALLCPERVPAATR